MITRLEVRVAGQSYTVDVEPPDGCVACETMMIVKHDFAKFATTDVASYDVRGQLPDGTILTLEDEARAVWWRTQDDMHRMLDEAIREIGPDAGELDFTIVDLDDEEYTYRVTWRTVTVDVPTTPWTA